MYGIKISSLRIRNKYIFNWHALEFMILRNSMQFFGFQPNITLTIEAWDWIQDFYREKIDSIEEPVHSPSCNNKVKVEKQGSMGIGWFNLSYCMHNLDSKNTPQISIPYTTSIQVNSSTDQPLAETSSSPWAWIAVTNLFILLSILFFTISIVMVCIVRSMSKKMEDSNTGHTYENYGEETWP